MEQAKGECLVISTKDDVYCIGADKRGILRAESEYGECGKFCVNEGKLYAIQGGAINDILEDKDVYRIHDYRSKIDGIISHKGKIYHAEGEQFIDTLEDKIVNRLPHTCMASDGNNLYGAELGYIYNLLTGRQLLKLRGWERNPEAEDNRLVLHPGKKNITALGCFKRSAYFATENILKFEYNNRVKEEYAVYKLGRKEKIAERKAKVTTFAPFRGNLYDAVGNAIYNMLKDRESKKPIWELDEDIVHMAAIPVELWNEIVKRGRVTLKKGIIVMEE